jgi:hypothetical protein
MKRTIHLGSTLLRVLFVFAALSQADPAVGNATQHSSTSGIPPRAAKILLEAEK